MTTKMLIDAAHPEETRVVVTRGNRVEEFDFESANRRPLRGNIYLAKVTRVEPSLQAAFVDFGGNRHGFLAFSEIHPDYYQIPTADRQALLAEEAAAAADEERDDDERSRARAKRGRARKAASPAADSVSEAVEGENTGEALATAEDHAGEDHAGEMQAGENGNGEDQVAEIGGGGDAMEEVPTRAASRPRRQYKIQEVIKRRQILLVQVVKEERGNKGAALTTYLSLAGRYSVLMPNTARGGGISRKITNSTDRKRLKSMASELEVPEGMGVILRTAGAARTKVEIKRDFEYLMRLWESVRELTLKSTAPALVYEEGSLIKRAIRDLYSKDIEEIQVAGDEGYREAKDFMRMLMPSHAKAVQPYKEATPLFSRFGVESQLDAMFSNVVTLKSGGYIVINQTEALVSIDVNSGRSTREHNIEDTALKTNLEAAEEVARQLRLRDLAGLIVIDFIDMEEKRNNKAVERKLNDCLKNDRARIQVGRISHFGLLEMSRQRIRTGVLESSTTPCPHCAGTGLLRSTPSLALHVLRALEDTLLRSAQNDITLRTRLETAFYILNQKRESLRALEARFGVTITVVAEAALPPGQHFLIERGEAVQPRPRADEGETAPPPQRRAERPGSAGAVHPEDVEIEDLPEADEEGGAPEEGEERAGTETGNGEERKRRRRRRRRGRGGELRENAGDDARREAQDEAGNGDAGPGDDEESEAEEGEERAGNETGNGEERKRRRRRRGGRRNRRDREARAGETGIADTDDGGRDLDDGEAGDPSSPAGAAEPAMAPPAPEVIAAPADAEPAAEPTKKPRRTRAGTAKVVAGAEPAAEAPAAEAPAAKPARAPRGRKKAVAEAAVEPAAAPPPDVVATEIATHEIVASAAAISEIAAAPEAKAAPEIKAAPAPTPEPEPEIEDPNRPKRSGWWSRARQALGG
ncbi:Rne/Rng family ribonuclease [Rhabdaerophilum calidifontis]|uniref:Rne/Rng family ribonuclease n=1 Tax=Rhabdaerophilum calidifontis TaxID=2604328 RepID=UPI0012393FB8|nr:ribonuclease E/G [Rhabdaerophilum calidifontis]